MLIHDMPVDAIPTLNTQLEQALAPCRSLEEAAQTCANLLFETFEESLALIRVLVTIPYQALPPAYQAVVTMLAHTETIRELTRADTPVLTLLGTRGGDEDLRNTRHAFGIPLASADFVDAIPFVAELFGEIGVDVPWEDASRDPIHAQDVETDSTGFLAQMHVPDVQHAVTASGEKLLRVIAQQPLYALKSIVEINTIFGIGGAYLHGQCLAVIVFSREHLDKSEVERFMPVVNYFKTATLKLAQDGRLFT